MFEGLITETLSLLAPVPTMDPLYLLIILGSFLASALISGMLKRRFSEYSQIPFSLTGAEVAERMLRQNGIQDVRVVSVPGKLTDHYDPASRTVNLSEPVYHANSVAAAAVAAHECGHAIQHKEAYTWLQMRSMMVPAVQFSTNMLNFLLMASLFGMWMTRSPMFLWLWVAFFSMTTLFAFVTLPVEFDASKRALVWLERSGLAASMEQSKARNALFWAAMTYVAAAIGSLAQLLYYLMILLNRRE